MLYEETPVRLAIVQLRFTVLPETLDVNVTLGVGVGVGVDDSAAAMAATSADVRFDREPIPPMLALIAFCIWVAVLPLNEVME
jgi:hypothetical protein